MERRRRERPEEAQDASRQTTRRGPAHQVVPLVDEVRQADRAARAALGEHPAENEDRNTIDEVGEPLGSGARYIRRAGLGRGAQGEVFRAVQLPLGREVAIKELKPINSSDRRAESRFVHEMRIIGHLSHPNILSMHDVIRTDTGRLAYVMPVVDGSSLKRMLRERRTSVIDAGEIETGPVRFLQMFLDVCRGVAHAHSRGVIHRDLKPGNVLVGRWGEVVVVDWGLASMRGAGGPSAEPVIGSVPYAAPEAVFSRARPDPRLDVFSLGAILYEILTGYPPRPRRGRDESLKAYRKRVRGLHPELPSRRSPDRPISEELEQICMWCLSHDPRDRYPDAAAVLQAVQAFSDGVKRREASESFIDQGHREASAARQRSEYLAGLEKEEQELSRSIQPWADESEKRPLWDLLTRIHTARLDAEQAFNRAVAAYTRALAHRPYHPAARAALASLYFDRFLAAEARRDRREMELFRALTAQYDDGRYVTHFSPRGQLQVSGSGGRLSVRQYDRSGPRWKLGTPRDLGSAPIEEVTLPAGSYLARWEIDRRVVDLPLSVQRGQLTELRLPPPSQAALPEGFCLVAGGSFLAGGDREAREAEPREVFTASVAVGRFPVTAREYAEFLTALHAQDPAQARARGPRTSPNGESFWKADKLGVYRIAERDPRGDRWEDDTPVVLISWYDAMAFCSWRTTLDGRRYRLLNGDEWEKTGRGVDARFFPWGDTFDPAFCKMSQSRPPPRRLEPVGRFPADCSPYGVRDMAGGVSEWTSGWYDRGRNLREVRGGSWVHDQDRSRLCYRSGLHPRAVSPAVGFRLCTPLTDREGA